MAKRWYVIHTYSGYEKKVRGDLEHRIDTFNAHDKIVDIKIPTEEVTEVKEGGARQTKDVQVFPGYVLVRMEMTDETWQIVRNTPGVTGFVGLNGVPTPLRRSEFDKIMRRVNPSESRGPLHKAVDLEVGQVIKVINGPLKDFDGNITEVMPESGKVKVSVTIFGRETPVELDIEQIVRI